MSAWKRLPRWIRITTTAVFGGLLAGALFGYVRTERTHCAACGAFTSRTERGFALLPSLRLPFTSTDEVSQMPNTLRFLPPNHAHGRERSVGYSQAGPYLLMGAWGRGRQFPGDFARVIAARPGFADYVASRIDAGQVDPATIRALIAQSSDPDDDAHAQALARRGAELIAEFESTKR